MGRYALLLGTATYLGDRDLTALPAVRHDLAQVKATLDHAGEFDRVDVHVDLTRDHLTRVVEEFFGARRRGDLALLYYSGHGLLHHDRESLFLATTDTNRERLHASAVDTAAVFKDMLSRTYATHKVVVLDCCFSGAFTAGNRFRSGLREEPRGGLRHPGTFILTSSTHQRASFTQGPDRPSVFTEVLLDGMHGKAEARGESTWLTTHDLSHYVQAELLRRGLPAPAESSEGVTEPIPIIGLRPDPAAMAREPGPGAEPGSQGPLDADRWRALVSYYVACIERSAVLGSLVDLADRERYQPMPAGAEPVLTGTGTPLHLSGELAAVAARARDGDRELRYGYPVVVRRSGSGRPGAVEFAPLLECDASVGPDGRLHTTMPPTVNLALAADCGLSSTEIDDLVTRVEETFVPGDASALAETVTQLSDVLGIPPAVPTDPRDLAGTVRAGPLRRLQNTAVLYAADAARTPAGQLLEDLRQELATKPGAIEQTALGVLTDLTPPGRPPAEPDRAGPDVTIVAPDLLNDAQERVIRAAMTSRLTIAQGPPGTGKSQLVTALVATATAAGQTVLVGSTNNRAVSEVSDRCTGLVGPGLIVRSGNKEYLAQEPQLLAGLLATHGAGRAPDDRTPAAELRLLQADLDAARSALDARRALERDLAELAAERLDLPEPAVALPDSEPALRDLVRHAERAPRRVRGWWSRRKLRAFGAAAPEQFSALAQRATVELRWLQARKALAALPDEHQVWAGLGELTRQRRPAVSRALLAARVAARVRDGRAILQRRCEEMSRPKPRSWSGFPRLLEALPAWAVTAMSARRLPPTPALFDLVIIDEAAACTIPAVLPMLFRARRAPSSAIRGSSRRWSHFPTTRMSASSDAPASAPNGWRAGGWSSAGTRRTTRSPQRPGFPTCSMSTTAAIRTSSPLRTVRYTRAG